MPRRAALNLIASSSFFGGGCLFFGVCEMRHKRNAPQANMSHILRGCDARPCQLPGPPLGATLAAQRMRPPKKKGGVRPLTAEAEARTATRELPMCCRGRSRPSRRHQLDSTKPKHVEVPRSALKRPHHALLAPGLERSRPGAHRSRAPPTLRPHHGNYGPAHPISQARRCKLSSVLLLIVAN